MPENPRPLMLGNFLPYQDMQALVFRFEKVLGKWGVKIEPGSDLERVCLAVMDILAKKKQPELLRPLEDIRCYFADVLGLWVFMDKLVRLADNPDFGQVVPHLTLLRKGGAPQNVRSPVSDPARNKLFELLVALICMEKGTNVLLDDPDESKGDNPDVIASILGQRWGFACKTMYSPSPETMYDRIEEGIRQIEDSEAEVGCVVVNMRNLIDHDHAWPILNEDAVSSGGPPVFGCWPNPRSTAHDLASLACKKRAELEASIGEREIRDTFKAKKSVPAYLAYLQTAAVVASPLGPVPSSVGGLFLATFGDVSRHLPVFQLLNSAMHHMI